MGNYDYVPVVFITDDNFIMQTGVAITSLIRNKKATTRYEIYVIAAECDASRVERLREIDTTGCSLTIIKVNLDDAPH